MPIFDLPYLCTNPDCRAVFRSGFVIQAEGLINNGEISASCPECGSVGYVPNGDFKTNKDIFIALLREIDEKDILDVSKKIKQQIHLNKKPEEIKNELNNSFPKYKKIWNKLPKNVKETLFILNIMLSALGSLAGVWAFIDNMSDDEVEKTIISPVYKFYFGRDASRFDNLKEIPKTHSKEIKM